MCSVHSQCLVYLITSTGSCVPLPVWICVIAVSECVSQGVQAAGLGLLLTLKAVLTIWGSYAFGEGQGRQTTSFCCGHTSCTPPTPRLTAHTLTITQRAIPPHPCSADIKTVPRWLISWVPGRRHNSFGHNDGSNHPHRRAPFIQVTAAFMEQPNSQVHMCVAKLADSHTGDRQWILINICML